MISLQGLLLDWGWDEELYADLLTVAGRKGRIGYYVRRYRPGLVRLIREADMVGVRVAIATKSLQSVVETLVGEEPSLLEIIDVIAGAAAVLLDLGKSGKPALSVAGPTPTRGLLDRSFLEPLLQ